MSQERLLFVQMTKDYIATSKVIKKICDFYEIEFREIIIDKPSQLLGKLEQESGVYNYIYLGGHGNEQGIAPCDSSEDIVKWADFAGEICGHCTLAEDTVLYLGCCKGALKRSALIMMVHCNMINHICGSQCNLTTSDAAVAFHNYIYMRKHQRGNKYITENITQLIQKEFMLYSRNDYDLEISQLFENIFYNERIYNLHSSYFRTQHYKSILEKHRLEELARQNTSFEKTETSLVPELA